MSHCGDHLHQPLGFAQRLHENGFDHGFGVDRKNPHVESVMRALRGSLAEAAHADESHGQAIYFHQVTFGVIFLLRELRNVVFVEAARER